jgi:hypothetical protein
LKNVKRGTLDIAIAEMGQSIKMNLGLDYKATEIKNTWGHEKVTAAFTKDSKVLSLGVNLIPNQEGTESLQVTGDFYSTGLNEATFTDQLSQSYKKVDVTEQLEEQGWSIDEVTVDEHGQIIIEAYQLA